MQEDFLHYIWQYKKFEFNNLLTTQHEELQVIAVGQHNHNAGPDFFNAQLNIAGQRWAGNVEIHIKSSDWFVHNHEQDKAYDNVILHVVYEHDTNVFRKDNTAIPTLELKNYIHKSLLQNYQSLMAKQHKWINCENNFAEVNNFTLENWLERLYIERLQRKANHIETLLQASTNNWEAVLFMQLAKNFGLKVNAEAFYSMAQSIPFSVIRKVQSNQNQLEALLYGQAGMLQTDVENAYVNNLKKEYQFLKQKFQIDNNQVVQMQFFRLRPSNFPTIRISQLANLYHQHQSLFSKVIEANSLKDFYKLFKVATSEFWLTHYTFDKASKSTTKSLTKPFIDLLLINTILPIKFCYAKQKGNTAVEEEVLKIANAITSESNAIITAFNSLKKVSKSAMNSQALIQLKTEYCDKNKCLQCAVGNALIIK